MAYATVAEANEYVKNYYGSTDPIRLSWEALTDDDKQVAMNRSEQTIDLLPYKGYPVNKAKAFPREPHKELSLEKVKIATIELALQTNGNKEVQERLSLRQQGVKSYKIGDLSETFKDGPDFDYLLAFAVDTVMPYLRDWLGGGYRICPTRKRW